MMNYEIAFWFLLAFINMSTAVRMHADLQKYKDIDWTAGKWIGRIVFLLSILLFISCTVQFSVLAIGAL